MQNTEYFRNKKITIIGLARSGLACAELLSGLGAQVSVSDKQDNDFLRVNAAKLTAANIKVELGRHSGELIKASDMLVVSPGVQYNAEPLVLARKSGIPVISEIEVGWILCPATIIAVTGSNGKTTVTTLIGRILEASGKKAFICGNIGKPFCQELDKMREGDFVCLEASSFQLETIERFKPKVAVILNFSRNHLDRHKDMQEYLDAKKRIFMNQDNTDFLVLNYNDPVLRGLDKESRSKAVYFKEEEGLNPNQAAALAACAALGVKKETAQGVFRAFKGVEHRLEQVVESGGVEFINDSKSTTVESTMWALRTLKRPVILIAGGRDKNLDYSIILELACKKTKEIILIGEARDKIRRALKGYASFKQAFTMQEAVGKAMQDAVPGDCVLLSPMCASFDMFSDYEERGRVFKMAVRDLIKEGAGHGA